jgi:hypothetical protein
MDIKGKVFCLFEQSGTFKNEFIKLGYPAEDYDIQNSFGETNHVVDLFKAIEDAYECKPSLFDNIGGEDLILAFFPCIYFCETSQCAFRFTHFNYRKLSVKEITDKILERSYNRTFFYNLAIKMCSIAKQRGLRLIMENPWSSISYLKNNFVEKPQVIDMDRTRRGDYYKKPTAFWYFNCEPTFGATYQKPKQVKTIRGTKGSSQAGLCGEERSMISPDYARNFICDFILGRKQQHTQLELFE